LGEAVTLNGTVGLILVVIGLAMQSFSAGEETPKRKSTGRHRSS
jgi:hypothetical protein